MQSDTRALEQARIQREQSFPQPSIRTAGTGLAPTHCLSKQSRVADRCHTRADIGYGWRDDICELMAREQMEPETHCNTDLDKQAERR